MVSSVSIIFMISSIIISVGVPLFLLIWVRKKYQASLLSFFVGMIAWIVAVQILEAPVHLYFLSANEITANFLFTNPIAYMLYGGLMAGLFEETARLVCFKFLLKKQTRIQDALSYGIGHGGVEAILLVGITYVSNLALSVMLNNGTLATLGLPTDILDVVTQQLVQTSPILFGVAGIERFFAIIVHIGLSVLVFQAVKNHKYSLYFLAIFLHALLNFPAALLQVGYLNMALVEGFVALFGIGFAIYLVKVIQKNKLDLSKGEDEELEKYQAQRF